MRPKTIIVDIDGTLAHPKDRDLWNASTCINDDLCFPVKHIMEVFIDAGYEVLLLTARPEFFRTVTEEWLSKHSVTYTKLIHKPQDMSIDGENAVQFKRRALRELILPSWDVRFVIDDEQPVVEMWREEGVECLQVIPPKSSTQLCGDD